MTSVTDPKSSLLSPAISLAPSNFSQSTLVQRRFHDSTHLIPTPVDDERVIKRYDPLIMKLPVVIGVPLLMFALGIALEAAIVVSNKQGGFLVPQQNAVSFVSVQFLLSFFPTLLVIPVALLWRELDWFVRWYQPYIALSNGNARAEETLMLDYIALGPFFALFKALHFKHRVVFWSSLVTAATYILQPLAGSIFQIRQSTQIQPDQVTSVRTIGLAPDVDQLNAFVAAAGFAEAAAFLNLTDPPFVFGGWATAQFVFPTITQLNGTMTVNTTGIQTQLDCANGVGTVAQPSGNLTVVNSKSVAGCNVTTTPFDPSLSTSQYGVKDVACGDAANLDIEFRSVMFWYYSQREGGGTPNAKAVFCSPSIEAYDVQAGAKLSDGSLYTVSALNDYAPTNNVTGPPLSGKAFNALLFPNNSNPFIQARATAIASAISGAVFRFAAQSPAGTQGTFDLPNGFLDITSTIYKQHLSLSAMSIYFVPDNATLDSQLSFYAPRLTIDSLPGHALALILIFVGIVGIGIHILNRKQRRNLSMASPPGTIATIISLTSRSGFGELLLPYDNEKVIERKLSGLRFRLDRRTGAILADEDPSTEGYENATTSLLVPSSLSNSSHIALAAAAGYPPWKQPPLKTPYDQ
ncbi:hypothetical protein BDN72DRAFT_802770 [Pluteus cervinus]|uniref:Uncharacterized protein n=1 Tax=Pluteus cervinus TaxID=181527 RepID=A0ACD3ADG6_9AGAR|nr:hypothetical protein BDN72DRAFT_802770 [Pluteus cervinus]